MSDRPYPILFSEAPLTPTKNPMTRVYGVTPGEVCRDCVHCTYHSRHPKRFYKCLKRRVTDGAATDHRVGWPACGLFEATPKSDAT